MMINPARIRLTNTALTSALISMSRRLPSIQAVLMAPLLQLLTGGGRHQGLYHVQTLELPQVFPANPLLNQLDGSTVR